MKKNKILCYIEQPPPMHGMTYINKIIYDNFRCKRNYAFFNTNFTIRLNAVGNVSWLKIKKNVFIVFNAWKYFFKVKPDVVYSMLSASTFGILRDIMVNFMAILFKKKLVLHLHGFTYYKIYTDNSLYKVMFNFISKNAILIVLCQNQKDITFKIMNKESIVLHNCLNTENNIKKNRNKNLKLCYISNISMSKGTIDLVKAVLKMPQKLELTIAGEFLGDKEEFLELINNQKTIKYVGFADEIKKHKILNNSDVFCLPSKLEEGSPISIIEAMSYGLPILSTNKGCIKDMIEDVGYLLEADYNVDDIIEALSFIDDNYDRLSSRSRLKYIENYSKDKFIGKLGQVLE